MVYNSQTFDDARLADLRATYFDDVDKLVVAVVLTNADGEFTKANGHLELTIQKDGRTVYSNEYDFTKDDFLTWDNLFGGQTRGVPFGIDQRFSGGDHDVSSSKPGIPPGPEQLSHVLPSSHGPSCAELHTPTPANARLEYGVSNIATSIKGKSNFFNHFPSHKIIIRIVYLLV